MTNLDVESVTHLEPANFWIGPSAVRYFFYILGGKLLKLINLTTGVASVAVCKLLFFFPSPSVRGFDTFAMKGA